MQQVLQLCNKALLFFFIFTLITKVEELTETCFPLHAYKAWAIWRNCNLDLVAHPRPNFMKFLEHLWRIYTAVSLSPPPLNSCTSSGSKLKDLSARPKDWRDAQHQACLQTQCITSSCACKFSPAAPAFSGMLLC